MPAKSGTGSSGCQTITGPSSGESGRAATVNGSTSPPAVSSIRRWRALLTDFELAKLLGNAPTVSADWPDDPYRAPEVETGSADKRADLYSWARILVHAALGRLPAIGEDAESLSSIELPRALKPLVCDCLSPAPSDRPGSLDKLLRPLRRWAEKT